MPPNHGQPLLDAPLGEIVVLLLKQFKRLLSEHHITLTSEAMDTLGQAVQDRTPLPALAASIVTVLAQLVADSDAELHQRFGLTFAQALATDMDHIGGWETTAEFLEIANHKSNAELRISTGSALLVLLGNDRFRQHVETVLADDGGVMDVDGAIAFRALQASSESDTPQS